jgi:hypothetical protein
MSGQQSDGGSPSEESSDAAAPSVPALEADTDIIGPEFKGANPPGAEKTIELTRSEGNE